MGSRLVGTLLPSLPHCMCLVAFILLFAFVRFHLVVSFALHASVFIFVRLCFCFAVFVSLLLSLTWLLP